MHSGMKISQPAPDSTGYAGDKGANHKGQSGKASQRHRRLSHRIGGCMRTFHIDRGNSWIGKSARKNGNESKKDRCSRPS